MDTEDILQLIDRKVPLPVTVAGIEYLEFLKRDMDAFDFVQSGALDEHLRFIKAIEDELFEDLY